MNKFIIVLLVIFALIGGTIYYLSNRLSLFFPVISYKTWIWGLSITTLLCLSGTLLNFLMNNNFGRIFFIILAFWITLLLYMVMIVAILDLTHLLFKISPFIRGIITVSLTLLLIVYGFVNASIIRVKQISIPVEGLSHEIKAVHISDVHIGNFWGEKRLEKIVNIVNEIKPEVLFNTGDMFDHKTHINNANILYPLKKLTVPHFFVYGNHDEMAGVEKVITKMKKAGVIVLQNEVVNFGGLQIVGLNNMREDDKAVDVHANQSTETIQSVLEKLPIDETLPTLVLHHRPAGMGYLNHKKTDLFLTGHTHAGQLFPFTLITKAMYHYNKGLYHFKDMCVYVNAGIGTAFMPIRIGTNSEITVIILTPQ